MMITNEKAECLALDYLNQTGGQFFYKFIGITKSERDPNLLSVQFLWSDVPDRFTIDGPLIVNIDAETGSIIV
jgi:hypothetical protein